MGRLPEWRTTTESDAWCFADRAVAHSSARFAEFSDEERLFGKLHHGGI
jgi:hypothetical protein